MRLTLFVGASLLLSVPGAISATETEKVQVQLEQGIIEGAKSDAGDGRSIYSFQTIPFAQPPVGDLRFKVSFKFKVLWLKLKVLRLYVHHNMHILVQEIA